MDNFTNEGTSRHLIKKFRRLISTKANLYQNYTKRHGAAFPSHLEPHSSEEGSSRNGTSPFAKSSKHDFFPIVLSSRGRENQSTRIAGAGGSVRLPGRSIAPGQ